MASSLQGRGSPAVSRQYIFFDLGWTLEDETAAQVRRAEEAVAAATAFGVATSATRILELQEDGAAQHVPSVFRYALRQIGLNEEQAAAVKRRASWDKGLLFLYPDSRAVLNQLSERHFLGLIANQSPGTERRLHDYGIAGLFGLVLASAELGLSKPDPALFALALERAGCSADKAWMVGDRLDNDIRPAKMAGWRTIRILNGYNARQQPRDDLDVPDYTLTTLTEILRILPMSDPGKG